MHHLRLPILLLFFLAASSQADDVTTVISVKQGLLLLSALRAAHPDATKGRKEYTVKQNELLLATHKARLDEEISEYEKLARSANATNWWEAQSKTILAMKKESLKEVEKAHKKLAELKGTKGAIPRFRDFRDILHFAWEDQESAGAGGMNGDGRGTKLGDHGKNGGREPAGNLDTATIRGATKLINDFDCGQPMDVEELIDTMNKLEDEIDLDKLTKEEQIKYKEIDRALTAIFHHPRERESDIREREELRKNSPELQKDLADFSQKLVALSKKIPESIDLSSHFPPPELQGNSIACGGFAIVDNMMSHKGIPPLSAPLAYSFMTAAEKLGHAAFQSDLTSQLTKQMKARNRKELLNLMDRGLAGNETLDGIELGFETLKKHPIAPAKDFPNPISDFISNNINAIKNRKYAIGDYASLKSGDIPPSFLREVVASKQPVIVSIGRDAKTQLEGWIRPEYAGKYAHVVNVVGYGKGRDPFNLEEEEYFIVRDSFTSIPIHYKISARELIPLMNGIYRATEVKQITPPKYAVR